MESELSNDLNRNEELFAQIGSKRPWVDRVLEMVKGKSINSVFDPCAGAGHLPIAVGEEKEAEVILNDVNPVNYYYLNRKCKGGRLPDEDFKDWKSSPKRNGFFTDNFSKPKKSLRRYIDGLVENADSWMRKSYLSDLLRRIFHRGDVPQTGDSDITTVSRAKSYLKKIHEADDYGMDVGCKISNKSIEDLEFPNCDLAIFDPPYQGKASSQSADAEVLMQKEIDFSFPHDELGEIMDELKKSSSHQLFFGGPNEKEVMESLGMEVDEWELNTGGMDWSKGNRDRVEYIHASLSQGLREELLGMETGELLKLEMEFKASPGRSV